MTAALPARSRPDDIPFQPAREPQQPRPPQPLRRHLPPARRLAETVTGLVACVLAVTAFDPFYDSRSWLPVTLGALLMGAVVAILLERHCPDWLLAPLGALALLAYHMWAVRTALTSAGIPTSAALRAAAEGMTSGWTRMLSVALPAPPDPDVLAFPVTLAFGSGFLMPVLVLRTSWRVGLTLPPVAVLVAGLAWTASRSGPGLALTAAVVVVLLVLLLLRAEQDREPLSGSRTPDAGPPMAAAGGRLLLGLPGALLVVAVAVTGAVLDPLAHGDHRADPRDAHEEPVELRPTLSPLVQVQPTVLGARRELYRVQVQWIGARVPLDRIRIAALDSFDGALWTSSGNYLRAGSNLPVEQPALQRPQVIRLGVHLSEAPTSAAFLPVAGQPTRVSGVSVAVDAQAGTLVALSSPKAGDGYTVEAMLASGDDLESRGVGAGLARYAALPEPPAWVSATAHGIVDQAGAKTAWGQLAALQSFYRNRPYAPNGPPGESYAAIYRTLQGSREDQAGHVEQYASGFAVLARALGFPSRVAIGYRISQKSLVGDTYVVTTAQMHAWPEVFLDGYGWVAFEPSNPRNSTVQPPPRRQGVPAGDAASDVLPPALPNATGDVGGTIRGTRGVTDYLAWGLWVLLGLALLAIVTTLLVLVVKEVRRRRRRSGGDAARRVVAAWQEVCDRLRELGRTVPGHATPTEVASGAAPPVRAAVTELAVITTSALFAPQPPAEPAAARAWELEAAIRRELRATAGLPRTVLSRLSLRTLFRRRDRDPGHPSATGSAPQKARIAEPVA